jgi:hypothetical protein
MKHPRWLALPALMMVLAVLPASAASQNGAPTVGEFALQIWRAMGRQASDQTAAATGLAKAGVDLGNLNTSLTAGRAASILRDLGVKVAVLRAPANSISAGRATQLARAIALLHGKAFGPRHRDRPDDCHMSPADPEDCQGDDDDDQGDDDDHDGDHDDDHDGDHDHGDD